MQHKQNTLDLSPPQPDLFLTIVLPCYNELYVTRTLDSLYANEACESCVEIYIILNHGEEATPQIKNRNESTAFEVESWIEQHNRSDHQYFLIRAFDLPTKKAGVGYARKIGMDLGQSRLTQIGVDGLISNLDADCIVSKNYCRSIIELFKDRPSLNGASIYFEHRAEIPENHSAIIQYELHLRIYVQALRKAGFPLAFHTVGSSMACRCSSYKKQGGMNSRKAGEDFYFIQKLLRLGDYRDTCDAVVYPSSRTSERVPFGTGKAMLDMQETTEYFTYSLDCYDSIRLILNELEAIYEEGFDAWIQTKDPAYYEAYLHINLPGIIKNAYTHSRGFVSFRKRFSSNFDGFKVMKLLHYGRDHYWPNESVNKVARQFLESLDTPEQMLFQMRNYEKSNPCFLDANLNVRPA